MMVRARRGPEWRPPTDLYELDKVVIVRVEVAGMQSSDFHISLEERRLVIRGVRPDIHEQRAFHQMEISFGEFYTDVELPCPVDAAEVKADYRGGFLRIEMPKVQPRKVPVEQSSKKIAA